MIKLSRMLFLSGLWIAGCSSPSARIHPDYRHRAPETVRIDVRNETLRPDLRNYRVSRLLQTSIFGPSEVNVFAVLFKASQDELVERGYSVEQSRPVEEGEAIEEGAVLQVRILSWGRAPTSVGGGLRAQLDFELLDYPSKDVLYQRSQSMDTSRDLSRRTVLSGIELEKSLRTAVQRGLSALPPRSGGPP